MSHGPRPLGALLEHAGHGVLLGVLAGVVSGAIEYFILMQALSVDLGRAFWQIVVPYALMGAAGGLLLGLGLRLVLGPAATWARHARLVAAVVAGVALAYVVVWVTYALGKPVFKLANLAAYAAALAAALALGAALAWVLARILRPVEGERSRTALGAGLALALALAIGIGLVAPPLYVTREYSPSVAAASAARAGRPNVLFIVIDALRADHLPWHGYSRNTAPFMTEFTRESVTFTRMYAHDASTRPSVASIFTSLYPVVHKANENRDYLPNSIPRLAEYMQQGGYRTYAVSANANVSPTFGYSKGFDKFQVWKVESPFRITMMGRLAEDALTPGTLSRLLGEEGTLTPTADAITDAALAWFEEADRRPFFAYVHYLDPHDPYRPPPPYDKKFDQRADPPRRRGGTVDAVAIGQDVDRDKLGRMLDQYDGEILFTDVHVGRLVRELGARGLLDNTVVFITADHGEEFYDHGQERHGKTTYEEVIHIPFLVAWKGKVAGGATHDGLVGHVDMLPTILDLVGLPVPKDIQGQSVARAILDPATPAENRLMFAQIVQDGFANEMVRDGRYKYIRHLHGPRQGMEELYDLEEDPLERTNLVERAPARAAGLRKTLDAYHTIVQQRASQIQGEQVKGFDRDTERALRSLGYIK